MIVAVALFFVHWVATISLMIPVSLFFLSCVGDLNIVVGNDIMSRGGVVGVSVNIDCDDVMDGNAWVHNGCNNVRVDLSNVMDGNRVSLNSGVLLLVKRSVNCGVLACSCTVGRLLALSVLNSVVRVLVFGVVRKILVVVVIVSAFSTVVIVLIVVSGGVVAGTMARCAVIR